MELGPLPEFLDRMSRNMADDIGMYDLGEFSHEHFREGTPPQMRTIPVGISVAEQNCIASYDDVRNIISNTEESISIMKCMCRQRHDLLGSPREEKFTLGE